MVPIASKPGKPPKPPTPPKPVQYQPVNYKRLIDSKYSSSPLLQLGNNNYDSILDRSLTDDTAPLIEEEAERPPAVPNRVKPPLLPKPQHILPPSRTVIVAAADVTEQPVQHREEKRRTNPFIVENGDEPEVRTSPSSPLSSTNPFENLVEQQETQTISVEEKRRSTNPFEVLSSSSSSLAAKSISQTKIFNELLAHRLNTNCAANGVFETSRTITTSLESNTIFKTTTNIESGDFDSLEEIHRQFNSDKECLIDRSFSIFSSNKLVRRHHVDYDTSNRSSWRSNSDLETGDESLSRSSSINESSRNGSPIIITKLKSPTKEEGSDEKVSELGDDDSLENSSSDNSYSVRRRIKTWFGSFGKGNNKSSKRRDSKFYVDPDSENKNNNNNDNINNNNMWETTSISSSEEKNDNGNDLNVDEESKVGDLSSLNGNCEPCLTDQEKREKKAYLVIKELISSEKVFIDVLKLLTVDFVNCVKSADRDNPIVPESELVKIINYLPQLRSFNEELLRDFESRIENWSSYPKISDIIIKKGPFLKLFSTYIQNFENQCTLLDDCCHKYHRFGKMVKDFEGSDRCAKLTLKHYMLKPVQRLPQYRLLLEDYLSQQNTDSIDYEDTQQALRIVCDVAEHANRSVEQGMHMSKLLQIQAQLGNYEIIRPGREFVKAGELYKLSRKEMQLRYFILLNDCLLYTSYYGSMFSLTVKYKIPLAGMKVCLPQIEDYNNEFSIISTTRSFTLRAKLPNERDEWVSALEKTIKERNRKQLSFSPKFIAQSEHAEPLEIGKEAPVWVPDARVTMCQVCTAEFKVTFRRHHCRACGKVVCSNCSDNKAPLQYMHFRAARVCDDCYQYLLKEYTDPDSAIMKYIMLQSDLSENDAAAVYSNIRTSFKKHDPPRSKKLPFKYVPPRLKETANDSGSVCSWLHRKTRKSWKRNWFKLKEQVLYVYKASEDVIALETIPVLGYEIETFKEVCTAYEDIDSKLVFQLAHVNQDPLVFYADTEMIANRWIAALKEAVSISV